MRLIQGGLSHAATEQGCSCGLLIYGDERQRAERHAWHRRMVSAVHEVTGEAL